MICKLKCVAKLRCNPTLHFLIVPGVVHRGMLREYSSIREQVLATTQQWLNATVKEVLVTGTSGLLWSSRSTEKEILQVDLTARQKVGPRKCKISRYLEFGEVFSFT